MARILAATPVNSLVASVAFAFASFCLNQPCPDSGARSWQEPEDAKFELQLQFQVETAAGSGQHHTRARAESWDASRTAVIVCDMWDLHHCLNAVRRVEQFAPRLEQVLKHARDRGATIIHAPSGCMEAYTGHPARNRAQQLPTAANLPQDIDSWCNQIPSEEQAVYPLDQSDGGEDDDPREHAEWAAKLESMGRNPRQPWQRQTKLISIDAQRDFISDRGSEVWNILESRDIDNVILTGVHTNMCVLGRPFGLRQMARNGKNVVLMRDMTDTMYNPAMWPYVNHFTGTDLIVSHIERHVCPTITSDQMIGGRPFRFPGDDRPRILIAVAEREYETSRTLPDFAGQFLGKDFQVDLVFGDESDRNQIPGLERLDQADIALFSIRRRALPPRQLDAVRRFVGSGKPVVGIRTTSHAFSLRDDQVPAGLQVFPEFDHEVFGGNYTGHYGNQLTATITAVAARRDHVLLQNVTPETFTAGGSLYKTSPVAQSATILLQGKVHDQAAEPVAWTFQRDDGGRSFYTSLGHPKDFENPAFQQLLLNGIYWASERKLPDDFAKPRPAKQQEDGEDKLIPQDQLKPSENVSSLKIPDDLELDLVLQDPQIANPLYLNFDERGQLWLVQYRQYPWPAGLKLISRDNVWRNIYDPPYPPPPPHADGSPFRGQDRITVHTDTDGDGHFDQHKIFLQGLNLATAALKGRGGVFVMNPPYLLFYRDSDGDDVADSQTPQILLSGFGIEDTHSIANNLRWGPDGWIYGTHGSTVSAAVRHHDPDGEPIEQTPAVTSMGQNIWRYHPEWRRYEIFAEGGGNAFGVEFDSLGHVYSGHNGGDTRGFHYVQGGYYLKNFGKHGSLSNPFAFGHYDAMKHPRVERFTHTFEIYQAADLPERYEGKLFGVSPNEHYVVASRIWRLGSSRQTQDIGQVVVPSGNKQADWFTPVDIQTGPDGALYIADWYSRQTNHYHSHEGETDPELGRVYRLRDKRRQPGGGPFDLNGVSSQQLVEDYLRHPNRWYRETALRLLGDRRDVSVVERLFEMAVDDKEPFALESVWALNLCGGLDDTTASHLLRHRNPDVRRWTVRLLGDRGSTTAAVQDLLVQLAASEPVVDVRLQLACSSRRWPVAQALPIVGELLNHDTDADDVFVPKMIWWAIEKHADHQESVLSWMSNYRHWELPLARAANIAENLMRRYAMSGSQDDLLACARLLELARNPQHKQRLLGGLSQAFAGRSLPALPDRLVAELADVEGRYQVVLGVRRGDRRAIRSAMSVIMDASAPLTDRLEFIRVLGEVQASPEECPGALIQLLDETDNQPVISAALASLQRFGQKQIGREIVRQYENFAESDQHTAQSVLASRPAWSLVLMQAVEAGAIPADSLEQDAVARMRWHVDAELRALVDRFFPQSTQTHEQVQQQIQLAHQIILSGHGQPLKGRELFFGQLSCGKCHRMFEQGGDIGPDLTSFNRGNVPAMLLSIIHPSAEIREGYESLTVVTLDGQVINGFVVDENDLVVILRSADGQDHRIARDDIDELQPSRLSLMPRGALEQLSDDELRDLFAFLTSTTPPK